MIRQLSASIGAAAWLAASCALAQPVWTGPYAGVSLGVNLGHGKWNAASTSDFPGTIVDASSPRTYKPKAWRASVIGGYSWRVGRWVMGPEVDFGLANASDVKAGLPGCTIDCAGAPGPGVDTSSFGVGWDASARARLGYLVSPSVLLYATSGVAWQHVRVTGLCQASLADPQCLVAPGDPILSEVHTRTLSGGTVGGGVEWALGGRWKMRAEYRRLMLGSFADAFFVGEPSFEPGVSTYRFRVKPSADIVTLAVTRGF